MWAISVSESNRITNVSFPDAHCKDVLPCKIISVGSEIELLFSGKCSVNNGCSYPFSVHPGAKKKLFIFLTGF